MTLDEHVRRRLLDEDLHSDGESGILPVKDRDLHRRHTMSIAFGLLLTQQDPK